MKKIILPILLIILCIIIGTRLIKADRESPQHYSTDYFIKNAIHQYQDCKKVGENNKTFVDYELL
jgi:ubiquinone biosynthesis protein COQ9